MTFVKHDLNGPISPYPAAPSGGGGGNPVLVSHEVNLGTRARRSGNFNITGSGFTIGKPVMIQKATGPYTGKGNLSDEFQAGTLIVSGKVISSTVIECQWVCDTPIRGNVKFNYFVGG
jgi:hypothetical protein